MPAASVCNCSLAPASLFRVSRAVLQVNEIVVGVKGSPCTFARERASSF